MFCRFACPTARPCCYCKMCLFAISQAVSLSDCLPQCLPFWLPLLLAQIASSPYDAWHTASRRQSLSYAKLGELAKADTTGLILSYFHTMRSYSITRSGYCQSAPSSIKTEAVAFPFFTVGCASPFEANLS